MGISVTLRIAFRALGKNKLRAGLTVLGVVIGIGAVTTMVSVGQSASKLIRNQFEGFGTNVIIVLPGSRRRRTVSEGRGGTPSLTAGDADAMSDECPSILASTPLVGTGGQLIFGSNNWRPKEMYGVGVDYLVVRNWALKSGGFFSERDVKSATKVCVVGQTIVEKLFQTTNPLGQQIRVRNIPFEIIGVLAQKGANMVGEDQDDIVLIPFTTVRKRIQGSSFNNVDAIMASAKSTEQITQGQTEIEQLLFERHRIPPGQPPDFAVRNTTEIADSLGVVMGILTTMLASIAGISLVVGGVGIMNIMLVSVTERTREIGIRMAVGARPRDILMQFLVESVLLSILGGIVGFGLGVAASTGAGILINRLMEDVEWPITVSIPAAITAILFSAAVGVFFGFYPARRASKLDPIDALRYE